MNLDFAQIVHMAALAHGQRQAQAVAARRAQFEIARSEGAGGVELTAASARSWPTSTVTTSVPSLTALKRSP
ncbi:MAG: hypothetical protein IPM80_20630, partial [Proteobacteria bacterium]|nr:hypothetical protein [Pseudomonadota bacterium]